IVAAYNEVVLAADHDKVLIITDFSVGFIERSNIEKSDTRTHMTLVDNSIKIGKKFLCKDPDSELAKMCRTKSAVGGKFNLLMENGHSILMQDNHLVIGPGPFDLDTDTYPAIVMDATAFPERAYYLDVREILGGEVNEVNPPRRELRE
ncbi:hypothetical protein PAEPH01_2918, partial [Pancytospora epiphaga]